MASMQKKLKITSVVVSHDLEIFKYVDKVALLEDRKIQYFGDAATIWESNNPYVHQFIHGLSEGPIQTELIHNKNKF
jgi:phospholipid/cholesterol/gamma-HCH transport system ATP-binding protein